MWTKFDADRWRIDPVQHRKGCTPRNCLVLADEPAHDLTSHYLLRVGDQMRELHVDDGRATLHVYEADEVVDDQPLALAGHIRSADLGPGDWTAAQAWTTLGEA